MKLLTKDNRLLELLSIGEVATDKEEKKEEPTETGTTKLVCRSASKRKVIIDIADVQQLFGVYIFPPEPK